MELSEPIETPALTLDERQAVRALALGIARPMLTGQGLGSKAPPDVGDLIRLADWIINGIVEPLYPYTSGDTLVLGPEIFVSLDHDTLCWKGVNYQHTSDDA